MHRDERFVLSRADRERFRFLFKLYRGVTHDGDDASIAAFLEALQPARERRGAVLLRFPFWFRNTQPNRARLSTIAGKLDGWPCTVATRRRGSTKALTAIRNTPVADPRKRRLYSGEELEQWSERVRSIASATDSVYVVTNCSIFRHFGGQAVANAFELARKLDLNPPDRPQNLSARLTQSFPHLL